jgi:hypothetical protein
MLSRDHNGWTDAPGDEREELDRCFPDSFAVPWPRCSTGYRGVTCEVGMLNEALSRNSPPQ